MAQALPLSTRSETWQRERFDFICSVVSYVDKDLLRNEISKCETEEEVQAILHSLLLPDPNDSWSKEGSKNQSAQSNKRKYPQGDVIMVNEEEPADHDDQVLESDSDSENGSGGNGWQDASNSFCSDDNVRENFEVDDGNSDADDDNSDNDGGDNDCLDASNSFHSDDNVTENLEIDGENGDDDDSENGSFIANDGTETFSVNNEDDNESESDDAETVDLDDQNYSSNTSLGEDEYEIVTTEETEDCHPHLVAPLKEGTSADAIDLDDSPNTVNSVSEIGEVSMPRRRKRARYDVLDSGVTLKGSHDAVLQVEPPVSLDLFPGITKQQRSETLVDEAVVYDQETESALFMDNDRRRNTAVLENVREAETHVLNDVEEVEPPRVHESVQHLEHESIEAEGIEITRNFVEVSDEDLLAIDLAMAKAEEEKDSRIAWQLDMIHNLFTGADPDFLQEKIDRCLAMEGDQQRFSQYVEELLKITKYPTMKEYVKKREASCESARVDYLDIDDSEQVATWFPIQCTICFEDKMLGSETGSCNSAVNEHIYCLQCIERYVKAQIEEGRASFRCMESGCKGEFSLKILRKILESTVLTRVLEQRQHEEITAAGIENLESCPFCNYKAIIQNPHDKVFRCINPRCMADSCRLCKEESHLPLRCEEIERDPQKEARKKLENKMSEAMIRVCPQCGKRFIKLQGCNNVQCSCGAVICYYCKHLVNSDHHKNSGACGQTADENAIHAREVRAAAYEGKLEMDPSIQLVHDPTIGIL